MYVDYSGNTDTSISFYLTRSRGITMTWSTWHVFAYPVHGIKCNGLVKQSALLLYFVRFEWSIVPALHLGKGFIWLPFHSVLSCFMLASPVILYFTADVINKLKVFLEFLYLSHEFCILWAPVSYSQSGGIDCNKAAGAVCGLGEGNCMSPFSWTVEWDYLHGFCWVLLDLVGFLLFFLWWCRERMWIAEEYWWNAL